MKVGIPWRPGPGRIEQFNATVAWWQYHGFEVLFGEDPRFASGPFNIAAARNWLVDAMGDEPILVLCDADTTPEIDAVNEAIFGTRTDGLVHLPYHLYRALGHDGSFIPSAVSGVMVFTRAVWEATNGQDERFTGWGYEDTAWALAVTTLVGPIIHHRGIATAAAHAPAPRDGVGANVVMYRAYLEVYGKTAAMLALVNGQDLLYGARPYRSRPL